MYRLVPQRDPNNPVALLSLGVIAHQREQHDTAVELIGKAIENNPQIPQFHNTLGLVFETLGKFEEAVAAYQQAVSIKPDYAEALAKEACKCGFQGWQVWRIAGARGIHEYGVTGVSADVDIEILKIKDMTYFGKKWLTGELYREMAYEGQHYTPEIIARFMNQLRDAKSRLESCHPSMLDAGCWMLVENRVSRNENRVYTSTFLLSYLRRVQLRSLWRRRITDFHASLSTK